MAGLVQGDDIAANIVRHPAVPHLADPEQDRLATVADVVVTGVSPVGASGSPGRPVVTQDEPMVSNVVAPAPTRPPPGLVDGALSLLIHAAWPLDPDRIPALRLRLGLDGEGPTSRGEVARATGLSRSVVLKAEERACELARRVGPPASLSAALRVLGGDILSAGEAAARLHHAG